MTIFPEFFRGPFSCGILSRAMASGLVGIQVHDLRDWTSDVHRTVDDRPFGGEEGMVLKIEPIDAALGDIRLAVRQRHGIDRPLVGPRASIRPVGSPEAGRPRRSGSCVRSLRGGRRTGRAAPSGRRTFDRGLCAERRGMGSGGGCRQRDSASAGCRRQPSIDAARVVRAALGRRGRDSRSSAVHPPGELCAAKRTRGAMGRARRAVERSSWRDSSLASQGGIGEDSDKPAGSPECTRSRSGW